VLLEGYFNSPSIQEGLMIPKLKGKWEEIAGEAVAAHSQPLSVKAGVLTIMAETSTWATQLSFLSEVLIKKINNNLADNAITQLRILNGASINNDQNLKD
jgi:predicted nucleic acid-binding Zn ribbon protein